MKAKQDAVPACPGCGEELQPGQEPHVTVKRVVRPNNKYGDARPGQIVEVEPRFLGGPTMAATMSLEEHEELEGKRAAARKAPKQSHLVDMVKQGFEAAAAQTRALIEAGKARAARAAERAAEVADDQTAE